MKLEGIYYIKPVEVMNKLNSLTSYEAKELLGDNLFKSLLFPFRPSWDKEENVWYTDEKNNKYMRKFEGIFSELENIRKYSSSDSNIKDKVRVFYKDVKLYEGYYIEFRKRENRISEEFITNFLEPEKSYKTLEMSFIRTASSNELAVNGSIENVENNRTEIELNMKDLEEKVKEELKSLEEEQRLMLEEIKNKFAVKMSNAKLLMAKKIAPLVKEVEDMTDKITAMESAIYQWLSYHGENYEIKKLSSGHEGTGKLSIFQKVRYLDEELPKLLFNDEASSYIDFTSFTSFEKLMAEYKTVRDFFIPSDKGIMVFQLSNNPIGTSYFKEIKMDKSNPKNIWLDYVKQDFEISNWNKLGMFVKNGDNLYVLWLDQDRIFIEDDNLFYSKNTNSVTNIDYYQMKDIESAGEKEKGDVAMGNIDILKTNYKKRRVLHDKFSARLYVADIIQGLLDNKPEILGLPVEQDVKTAVTSGQFKDVVFNNADGYISYSKWNSYNDIRAELGDGYKIGDPIYILVNEGGNNRERINASWNAGNITRDTTLTTGINKINLIDYEDTYYWTKKVTEDDLVYNEEKKRWIIKPEFSSSYLVYDNLQYGRTTTSTSSTHSLSKEELLSGTMTYKHVSIKDTMRIEEIDKSRPRVIVLNSMREDGVLGKDEYYYYRLMNKAYGRYSSENERSQALDSLKKYPELFVNDKGEYCYTYESNRVYHYVKNNISLNNLIDLGFKYNPDMFTRKEYHYVSLKKQWSNVGRANILVHDDEIVPLKNMTHEHINYMINNSIKLPNMKTFSESVKHLVAIREWLKSNKK